MRVNETTETLFSFLLVKLKTKQNKNSASACYMIELLPDHLHNLQSNSLDIREN